MRNDSLRLLKPVVGYGLAIALVTLVGWLGSSTVFADGLTGTGPLSPFAVSRSVAFCLTFLAC